MPTELSEPNVLRRLLWYFLSFVSTFAVQDCLSRRGKEDFIEGFIHLLGRKFTLGRRSTESGALNPC
ncbi:hypothetical protein CDAR_474781 [Caerostris darwini]|uniref:Secreted protein n=1 Tax=Caerostris darwini TaxID=1538125 RepID=A0AAV4MX15_9ARAC|nr:hypothetical protein CDAR_474781 [Caerostris darwini]